MTEMHTESNLDGVPTADEAAAKAAEDARYEGALEVEELLGEVVPEPSFDEMVTFAIKELYERQITLEGVVIDIITIIDDNALSPAVMAAKLRDLLIPTEEPQASEEG
jgi:hypothetical protein